MHTELILEELTIIHFKGITKLHIKFNPSSENIWGDNGVGKTSIADAIHWLLRGKNSLGEMDFGIKPLDKDNKKIEKTEVDVTGAFLLNERRVILRHVFKEKWSEKKGSGTRELTGNTHEYYVDNAPYTLAEYKVFIDRIASEMVFPLITNPLFFNNDKLFPWLKRRDLLVAIGGEVSNVDLARQNPAFESLVAILANKTLSKYKQEVKANKGNIKEQLDLIPSRIDENQRGLPDQVDDEGIQEQISNRNASLSEIDEQMGSITKASEKLTEDVRDHQKKVRALKLDQDMVVDKIKQGRKMEDQDQGKELREKKAELQKAEQNLTQANNSIDSQVARKTSINSQIRAAEAAIATLRKEMDEGREAWKLINAEKLEFKEGAFNCPTCTQALPEEDVATTRSELEKVFTEGKATRLKQNVDKGGQFKKQIEDLEKQITALHKELSGLEQLISARQQEKDMHSSDYDKIVDEIREIDSSPIAEKQAIEDVIAADPEYVALSKKISSLEASAPKEEEKQDVGEYRLRRQTINAELDELKKKLTVNEQRKTIQKRIEDLQAQEKDLAQQLADLEGKEDLIEKFTKAKIDTLTDRINDRFQIVRFKMFNYTLSGGVEETCEVMVDGVPYSDLNTAKRINAGIDVINVLCDHYKVHVPIIIDNRESTVRILETKSQVINLIVREGVKSLHVGKNPPAVLQAQGHLELS